MISALCKGNGQRTKRLLYHLIYVLVLLNISNLTKLRKNMINISSTKTKPTHDKFVVFLSSKNTNTAYEKDDTEMIITLQTAGRVFHQKIQNPP